MNRLTHWNPFRGMARIDAPATVDDFFREFSLRPAWRDFEGIPDIKIDVSEDERSFVVKADVPGVKKDDIEVTVDGRQVTIAADTHREVERREGDSLYSERSSGRVYRAFMLPTEADASGATAGYDNGVLNLKLPKKDNGHQRRISVS
jgi:HSP20 family protein